MKNKNIIIMLVIINIILMLMFCISITTNSNIIKGKKIIKEMTETEYEDYITSLNISHEDYAKYIEESKEKIASAITEMGVETSNQETLEIMANNIKNIGADKNGSLDVFFYRFATTNTGYGGYGYIDIDVSKSKKIKIASITKDTYATLWYVRIADLETGEVIYNTSSLTTNIEVDVSNVNKIRLHISGTGNDTYINQGIYVNGIEW